MKRTLLAVVPLACISVAAAAQNEQHNFDGFYAGAKAGISSTFANVDSATNANFITTVASVPGFENMKNGTHTILGHIFGAGSINLGYGRQLTNSQIYLGAELSGNAASRELSVPVTATESSGIIGTLDTFTLATQTRARLNTLELAIDFKPGVVVNPATLIYGRIGAAFNRMQTTSNSTLSSRDVIGFGFPPIAATNNLYIQNQKNVAGLRLGVGGEHFLTNNMTVSAEYLFTWYGSASGLSGAANVTNTFPLIGAPTTTPNGLTNTTSATMYSQAVMIGLNYFFNKTA